MKILLVTSVFKSESVGPARFARLLKDSANLDVDILTSGIVESEKIRNVNLKFQWWQTKLKIYFSIPQFQESLRKIEKYYDFIIFNNAMFADKYNGNLPYIVMVNDEKLISLNAFFKFDFLRRVIHRKIEKRSVKAARKVVVNSNYIRTKLINTYEVNSNYVHTLLKGISLEGKEFAYRHRSFKYDERIKILFVKNDYLIGGLLELIEGLGNIEEYVFELTIVGSNCKALNRIQFPKNISPINKGMISNKKVVELMYKHDILAIPSRYEPLGVAIMEGLAVGIPVVTTNQGGLPEVTNNGEYVWQCKPNSAKSIASKIVECIESPELRNSKSLEGREYVRAKFEFENVVNNLITIIHK